MVIIQAKTGNFVQLLHILVCQFAISLRIFSLITFVRFWFSVPSFLLALRDISCRLAWGCPISELKAVSTSGLVALTTSFLSSAYSGLTQDPKLCEEVSSLLCSRLRNTRHGFAFAVGEPSFEVVFWPLFDKALCFLTGSERNLLKMATREYWKIHDVQTKMVIPFITCEISFGQNVCEVVSGVNIFDLDLGFPIDSVEQPIKSNSVGSGHVSHRRTSSFNYQFDHGFVVFKNVKLWLIVRRMRAHNPHHSLAPPFAFFWHSGFWFGNSESHQIPGCWYVCCWSQYFNHDVPNIMSR